MPYKEKEIKKLYYTTGEVAEMLKLPASQIRFWETEFTFTNLRKNKKGDRLFTESDIDQVRKIHDLLKVKGFTIEGAKKELKRRVKTTETGNEEILKTLLSVKDLLLKLKEDIGS